MAMKVLSVADRMYQLVIRTRTPGEPAVVLESRHLTLVAESQEIETFGQKPLTIPTGSFGVPPATSILSENTTATFVNSKVFLYILSLTIVKKIVICIIRVCQ